MDKGSNYTWETLFNEAIETFKSHEISPAIPTNATHKTEATESDLEPSMFRTFAVVDSMTSATLIDFNSASFAATTGTSLGSVHFSRLPLNGCG